MMEAECLKVYSLQLDDDGSIISGQDEGNERPDVKLANVAKQLAAEAGIPFRAALERTLANPVNGTLVRDYHLFRNPTHRVVASDQSTQSGDPQHGQNGADDRIRELAEAHMSETGEKNFIRAVNFVLQENSDLRREYASCVGLYK